MKNRDSILRYHLLALVTITIWGTTFISTKVLINNGLGAADVFFYRFTMAYILIWFISPKKLFCDSIKEELTALLAGVAGGSLYFLSENKALGLTLTSNVALIVSLAPILTTLISYLFKTKESITKNIIRGSIVAFLGVAFVVFNGSFVLKLNPLGDFLSLVAAVSWAIYCLSAKKMIDKYSAIFVSRKVFFYGLLTISPYFLVEPLNVDTELLFQPVIVFNLLFLGVFASMICYVTWSICLDKIGAVKCTNYAYFLPFITLVASWLILDEKITYIGAIGSLMILCGVYIAERKDKS